MDGRQHPERPRGLDFLCGAWFAELDDGLSAAVATWWRNFGIFRRIPPFQRIAADARDIVRNQAALLHRILARLPMGASS